MVIELPGGAQIGDDRRELRLVASARTGDVAEVNARFTSFAAACKVPVNVTQSFNVVLDELLANIVQHGDSGGGEIEVSFSLDIGELRIVIADNGVPFNPLEAPPPDTDLPLEERKIGGLGIHLVRNLVDRVEYRRERGRNVVTLVQPLHGGRGP